MKEPHLRHQEALKQLFRTRTGDGVPRFHADLKARDSLALDLMEAVRPRVDAYLLGLLRSHIFAARDFFETRQGVCRVLPPLTHHLAETAPTWATVVAPIAESIGRPLFQPDGRLAKRDPVMPTLLTGANRSAGREMTRRQSTRPPPTMGPDLPSACRDCGVVLHDSGRAYCDGCLPERREESVTIFSRSGPTTLARRRAEGSDPAHGGDAGRERGRRNAEHVAAISNWKRQHGLRVNPDAFVRDVLPRLQDVPLRLIAEATGLSLGYCSFVRRGRKVPHPRHWHALALLFMPESVGGGAVEEEADSVD